MRNDLTVLEQGEHLARRQELIGFSRGGDRKSDEFQKLTVGLRSTKEIANEIGLSEASMKNRMQVARNIVPEVKDAIRNRDIPWRDLTIRAKNGMPRTIYGRQFPVLQAAQIRQNKPITPNAIKIMTDEKEAPAVVNNGRWKRILEEEVAAK